MIDHSRLRKARGPLTALVLLAATGGTVLLAPPGQTTGPSTATVRPGASTEESTRPNASVSPSTSDAPGTTAGSGDAVEVRGLEPTWPETLKVAVVENGAVRYRANVAGGLQSLGNVLDTLSMAGWGATSSDGKTWELAGTSSDERYTGTVAVSGDTVAVTLNRG